MPNPNRDTKPGQIYNDLRNLAKRTGHSTDALMVEYVLERFLYRLSINPLGRDHFVLKGGLLLAQFGARRMTRDIDILGRGFPGDEAEIIRRIGQIAATVCDGVELLPATLATVPIPQELSDLRRMGLVTATITVTIAIHAGSKANDVGAGIRISGPIPTSGVVRPSTP
jgi:hypothetical protein